MCTVGNFGASRPSRTSQPDKWKITTRGMNLWPDTVDFRCVITDYCLLVVSTASYCISEVFNLISWQKETDEHSMPTDACWPLISTFIVKSSLKRPGPTILDDWIYLCRQWARRAASQPRSPRVERGKLRACNMTLSQRALYLAVCGSVRVDVNLSQ